MATSASDTTVNLGLSQWAEDDYVLREDFNSDNAAIDTAYAAMDTAIDGLSDALEGKASTEALSTHLTDSQAHSDILSAKADVTALAGEAASRAANDYYVKLFDAVTTAAVSQIDLDFSSIDAEEYTCFELLVDTPKASGDLFVRVNNNSASDYRSCGMHTGISTAHNNRAVTSYLLALNGDGNDAQTWPMHAEIHLALMGRVMQGLGRSVDYGSISQGAGTAAAAYTPAALTSVNLVGSFPVNCSVKVYGIRR